LLFSEKVTEHAGDLLYQVRGETGELKTTPEKGGLTLTLKGFKARDVMLRRDAGIAEK
jgi:hypothetical protein